MELSRLVTGNCPFITNIPVYLATTVNGLKRGAVVCAGATGATRGFTLSVATTTAACKQAIGVLQLDASFAYQNVDQGQLDSSSAKSFRVQADLICDRGLVGGGDWLPAVINPDALYFAWYSTTQAAATASDTIVEGITASTGTAITVASLHEDKVGSWLFSHSSNSAGETTYSGSLRYVSVSIATGSIGLITAMNVSTDSSLVLAGAPGLRQTIVSSTGQHIRSASAASGGLAQGLYNWDNYIVHDSAPMHPLREWVDDGLDGLTGVKIYGEEYLYFHVLNQTTA